MVQPSSPPNPGRRKFLSYATSFLGLIGTAFVAVPFLSAFKPSARAEAAGAGEASGGAEQQAAG